MSKDIKTVKLYVCPSCFAREIDKFLSYDEEAEEYYCRRCCYVGKVEDIEEFYAAYKKAKYKDMAKPYPSEKY
jgi:late competence protein required for DNA uptake (superfamily II DNA/RNA helicase)